MRESQRQRLYEQQLSDKLFEVSGVREELERRALESVLRAEQTTWRVARPDRSNDLGKAAEELYRSIDRQRQEEKEARQQAITAAGERLNNLFRPTYGTNVQPKIDITTRALLAVILPECYRMECQLKSGWYGDKFQWWEHYPIPEGTPYAFARIRIPSKIAREDPQEYVRLLRNWVGDSFHNPGGLLLSSPASAREPEHKVGLRMFNLGDNDDDDQA